MKALISLIYIYLVFINPNICFFYIVNDKTTNSTVEITGMD
jgi:hypothetical protein